MCISQQTPINSSSFYLPIIYAQMNHLKTLQETTQHLKFMALYKQFNVCNWKSASAWLIYIYTFSERNHVPNLDQHFPCHVSSSHLIIITIPSLILFL